MEPTLPSTDRQRRARLIAMSGWVIVLLSAGSGLLPILGPADGAPVIGAMLVAAGLAEAVAAWHRLETRKLIMGAAVLTIVSGLLFATEAAARLLPALYIVAGWLTGRAILFFLAAGLEHGRVRGWTLVSALTDAALAALLIVGISIATLVVALFGATPPMIASFAWVLALSFVTTGLALVEVAACARREDV